MEKKRKFSDTFHGNEHNSKKNQVVSFSSAVEYLHRVRIRLLLKPRLARKLSTTQISRQLSVLEKAFPHITCQSSIAKFYERPWVTGVCQSACFGAETAGN